MAYYLAGGIAQETAPDTGMAAVSDHQQVERAFFSQAHDLLRRMPNGCAQLEVYALLDGEASRLAVQRFNQSVLSRLLFVQLVDNLGHTW
jgi:hypothetical protein